MILGGRYVGGWGVWGEGGRVVCFGGGCVHYDIDLKRISSAWPDVYVDPKEIK